MKYKLDETNLTILDLGLDGAHFTKVLARYPEVIKVTFSPNSITPESVKIISESLKTDTSIIYLSLWGSNIGPQEANLIAEALQQNTTLRNLDLTYTTIGDDGAAAIAGALRVNKTLVGLGLTKCEIGDRGAGALADALSLNSTLLQLFLNGNKIGNDGAGDLLTALDVLNTSLTKLTLKTDGIDEAIIAELAAKCKINGEKACSFKEEDEWSDAGEPEDEIELLGGSYETVGAPECD